MGFMAKAFPLQLAEKRPLNMHAMIISWLLSTIDRTVLALNLNRDEGRSIPRTNEISLHNPICALSLEAAPIYPRPSPELDSDQLPNWLLYPPPR